MKNYVVTFNVADCEFTYYTKKEWYAQVEDWKAEMEEGTYEECSLDTDTLVEYMYGNEMFWSVIPE